MLKGINSSARYSPKVHWTHEGVVALDWIRRFLFWAVKVSALRSVKTFVPLHVGRAKDETKEQRNVRLIANADILLEIDACGSTQLLAGIMQKPSRKFVVQMLFEDFRPQEGETFHINILELAALTLTLLATVAFSLAEEGEGALRGRTIHILTDSVTAEAHASRQKTDNNLSRALLGIIFYLQIEHGFVSTFGRIEGKVNYCSVAFTQKVDAPIQGRAARLASSAPYESLDVSLCERGDMLYKQRFVHRTAISYDSHQRETTELWSKLGIEMKPGMDVPTAIERYVEFLTMMKSIQSGQTVASYTSAVADTLKTEGIVHDPKLEVYTPRVTGIISGFGRLCESKKPERRLRVRLCYCFSQFMLVADHIRLKYQAQGALRDELLAFAGFHWGAAPRINEILHTPLSTGVLDKIHSLGRVAEIEKEKGILTNNLAFIYPVGKPPTPAGSNPDYGAIGVGFFTLSKRNNTGITGCRGIPLHPSASMTSTAQ